jgi:hypothetical protein
MDELWVLQWGLCTNFENETGNPCWAAAGACLFGCLCLVSRPGLWLADCLPWAGKYPLYWAANEPGCGAAQACTGWVTEQLDHLGCSDFKKEG